MGYLVRMHHPNGLETDMEIDYFIPCLLRKEHLFLPMLIHFAARMEWTLPTAPGQAVHSPVIKTSLNEEIEVTLGQNIYISTKESFDKDGRKLRFRWYFYKEAGTYQGEAVLKGEDTDIVTVTVPLQDNHSQRDLHLILEISNDAKISLTSYKRFTLKIASVKKSL